MKSIDEIINREDYKKLNEALKERSIQIAKMLRGLMYELEIGQLGDYRICEVKGNGCSEDYLGILVDGTDEEYHSLEHGKSFHYANDFHCWIQAATGQERLQFLNAAKTLFEEIDNMKTERCQKIENALSETESLISK